MTFHCSCVFFLDMTGRLSHLHVEDTHFSWSDLPNTWTFVHSDQCLFVYSLLFHIFWWNIRFYMRPNVLDILRLSLHHLYFDCVVVVSE